jgi:hypothetical protein
MIEFRYHLTEQDAVAGAMAALRSSVGRRQLVLSLVWTMPLGAAATGFERWLDSGNARDAAVGAVAGALCVFVWMTAARTLLVRYLVRRAFRNGTLVQHPSGRVWLDDTGMVDELPGGDRRIYSYADMSSIDETPTPVFICIGPAKYLILPRRCGPDAVNAIVEQLRGRLQPSAA